MRYVPLFFVILAVICIQVLIGGVRLVFSLPAYLLLATGALAAAGNGKPLTRSAAVCVATAISLAAWVVARALFSPVEYLARTDLLMMLAAVLMYLLTVTHFTTARSRLVLVSIFLLLAIGHVVVGAVQFRQGDSWMPIPGIMRPPIYDWRASGFYICPNHLAGLLEMMALLALSLTCWGNLRWGWRILWGYAALMCLGGIAITGSRGGYLSTMFGLIVFVILCLWSIQLMRRGGFWLTLAAAVVGGVVIVGGAFFFMSRSDSISTRLGQIYDPTNMRLSMWKAALRQYHLQPLTGTGSGTYLFYGRQFREVSVQADPMHVHNDYLELLAEYGLVGAACCALFVGVHLGCGLIGLRKIIVARLRPGETWCDDELALLCGAVAAAAALLFHSVLDFNLHIPANALLTAFMAGILARPAHTPVLGAAAERRTNGRMRWVTAAIALVLMVVSLRFLPGEIYGERSRVAFRDHHYAESKALARRALSWEKKNPFLYGYLGDAEHFLTLSAPDPSTGRLMQEDAASAYAAGLKLFPRDTGLLLKQAQVLDLLERYSEADEIFQRLLQYDPVFGNVYAYYGLHWELQRRLGAAERCFRVAAQLGEKQIAPKELETIERMKADPLARSLMSAIPGPDLDLPAERILPPP